MLRAAQVVLRGEQWGQLALDITQLLLHGLVAAAAGVQEVRVVAQLAHVHDEGQAIGGARVGGRAEQRAHAAALHQLLVQRTLRACTGTANGPWCMLTCLGGVAPPGCNSMVRFISEICISGAMHVCMMHGMCQACCRAGGASTEGYSSASAVTRQRVLPMHPNGLRDT